LEPHGFSFFTAVKISTTDGKVQEKKSMGVMAYDMAACYLWFMVHGSWQFG
jgi:hypothetical protein